MGHPGFFDDVPGITLRDPLAALLGAADDGLLHYTYLDAVKLAGHSCPTVASAYWLTRQALGWLYPETLPERGNIRVDFRETRTAGVTGVIANVVSLLTGAMDDSGFKGLGGQYARRGLLHFGADLPLDLRFTRLDTAASVDAAAHPARVPAHPETSTLLAGCLDGSAAADERARFAGIWQDRVHRLLLEYGDDPVVFELRPTPGDSQKTL